MSFPKKKLQANASNAQTAKIQQIQANANSEKSVSGRQPLNRIWRPWEVNKIPCHFNDCNATFKRESERKRHKHSVHQKSREICQYCPKKFTRKDNLTRHLKMHLQPNKPFCDYCKKPLSRQDAVQRHMMKCSKNPGRFYPLNRMQISLPNSSESDNSDAENMQ